MLNIVFGTLLFLAACGHCWIWLHLLMEASRKESPRGWTVPLLVNLALFNVPAISYIYVTRHRLSYRDAVALFAPHIIVGFILVSYVDWDAFFAG